MTGDPVFAIAQVLVLAKIMLIVLLLDPRSADTFTLPKSVAAHASSLVIAALLVWLVARHGRAVLFWSPLHLGVGAVVAAFAVATPFAADPLLALFGVYRRYMGLTQTLDNALLYLAVATLFRDPRSLRLLATVGIGVAVPVLGYAFLQRIGLDPLRFAQAETRIPISTMGNPDLAGAYVSVVGVSALAVAALANGRTLSWWRIAAGLIGLGCVAALYVTAIRAGLLAIGAGWLAVIVLTLLIPRFGRPHRIGSLAFAGVLAVTMVVSPIAARLDPARLASDPGIVDRLDIWQAAGSAFLERPILGFGPDNFAVTYPSRRSESSTKTGELQNSTHNIWLYMATSAGIAGICSLLLLVLLAVGRALRLARQDHLAALALVPLVAYLGQALVNVTEIVVDWMLWTSAGAIAGATVVSAPTLRRIEGPRAARLVGVVALTGALVLAFVGVFPRLAAGEAVLASEAYSVAGRPEAFLYGRDAVSADPRRPESWSTYGAALHRAGQPVAALSAFQIAARAQPWHPTSWKNLAVVWSTLGNRDAAFAAAERAMQADPYDGEAREMVATAAYERGDYRRAAAEGERALAYRPSPEASTFFTTTSAYVQLKDLDRAEALAREGVARFGLPHLRLQLAAILIDKGNTAEARSIVEDLLRGQPDNTDARRLKQVLDKL